MTENNVVRLHTPPAEKNWPHLACSKCGATAELKCDCGVAYNYIRAGVIAVKAVMSNPEKSDRAIAAEIGVSQPTVSRARKKTTDTNVSVVKRIGMDGKERMAPVRKSAGPRIPIPNGYEFLSDAIKEVIEIERSGISRDEAVKKVGIGINSYVMGRDIVLLSERTDLPERDAAIVKQAVEQLNHLCQVAAPGELVKSIAQRVWGKKGHRLKGGEKRLNNFRSSISYVLSTCVTAADIDVPYYLSNKDRDTIISELKEAETALYSIRKRINGST